MGHVWIFGWKKKVNDGHRYLFGCIFLGTGPTQLREAIEVTTREAWIDGTATKVQNNMYAVEFISTINSVLHLSCRACQQVHRRVPSTNTQRVITTNDVPAPNMKLVHGLGAAHVAGGRELTSRTLTPPDAAPRENMMTSLLFHSSLPLQLPLLPSSCSHSLPQRLGALRLSANGD